MTKEFCSWEEAVLWLRGRPESRELVEACYYDDPLVQSAQRYASSAEWQGVREYLGRTGRALDVGAGRGIASYALAKGGYQVVALEPDPSPIVGAEAIRNLAQETGLPITVVPGLSEALPFDDQEFDVVFARAVLHHTTDLRKACSEFARVLRPGGVLIAIREHVVSSPNDLEKFFDRHPLHKLYGGENAFLLDAYQSALLQAGLKIEKCIGPLESPINFAPNTLHALQDELVSRVPGPNVIRRAIRRAIGLGRVWRLAARVVSLVDHRPGRHYSFVCRKGS